MAFPLPASPAEATIPPPEPFDFTVDSPPISKQQLAQLSAYRGRVNDRAVDLNDKEHQPRTLKFVTFAGALDLSDKLYHGVLRFKEVTADAEAVAFDFSNLLRVDALRSPPSPIPVHSEPIEE